MLSYLNLLIRQVIASTWKAFAGGSPSDWAVKVVIGGATLWALYDRNKSLIDNNGIWDALRQKYLELGILLIAIGVYVVLYAIFAAPYVLWKRERERAIVAEAVMPLAGSLEEKRRQLEDTISAIIQIANARELWFDHHDGERRASAELKLQCTAVRKTFPISFSPDLATDTVAKLHDAAYNLGFEIGVFRTLPDKVDRARLKFGKAVEDVTVQFESEWERELSNPDKRKF